MEQGLKLLIQLVIEFAPVIASLIQKRSEANQVITQHQHPELAQEFIQSVNSSSQTISYIGRTDSEKTYQQQLAHYYYQTQLKIATHQRETTLKLPEVNKILDSWPLRLSPSQILENHTTQEPTPLKIFLAPPKVHFDQFDHRGESISDIELMLAEGLREFLNKYYSLHNQLRPTEFLAGAWDSKRFHSESSIKALFGMLKTEPILILESEADGDYLNFRVGYWGLGQENYYYKTIVQLPYKEIVYQSARERALEWNNIQDKLLALGEELEEINAIGGDNIANLKVLKKAEKWREKGIDVSKLSLQYQINRQDIEKLCQVLITCHCLAASWVTDAYHLIHHDVPPLLPELLPGLLQNALDIQSLEAITTGYKQLYQALEVERRYWIPELALQLAQSLSHLPDRTWAKEQLNHSINTWLQLRQVQQPTENSLQAVQLAVKVEDEEYLKKLRSCLTVIGDQQGIAQVENLLDAIANLKQKHQQKYAYLSHTLTGHLEKVTSVAISSDGKTLVSGCADKTIKVWNLKTGEVTRKLNENLGEVSSVAISSDGRLLAVGSCEHPKSNVKVWHLGNGKLLHNLSGHQKPVNLVVISPDGQILASASNKIKIWNLDKGERLCTLWHTNAVYAAVISSDGTILASGGQDHKIRLWNLRTSEPFRTLNSHSGAVKSLAMSPDGKTLVSASADQTIKIWELDSGKLLGTLTGHSDEVKSVVVSPDGQLLISASADQTIKIWYLQTRELLQTLTGHSGAVNSVAISPDSQLIASGSSDKTIKIWCLA